MKKFIAFLVVFLFVGTSIAKAQFTDFRPGIAETPEYKLTVGIPIIPTLGLMNLQSIGSIYSYFDTLTKLSIPNEYQDMGLYANQAIDLMGYLHFQCFLLQVFGCTRFSDWSHNKAPVSCRWIGRWRAKEESQRT